MATAYLQGCSQESSDGTKKAEIDSQQPSVSAAEIAYKNRSQEYPADFPLPKYPNSQLEVAQLRMSKRSSPTVILQTTDSVKNVSRFYGARLKEDGWDIGKVVKNNTYVVLAATREGREATIMITETRKGATAISLFVGKK